jgi:phosphate transport system ATP-binding protein
MKETKIKIKDLSLFYSEKQALSNITLDIFSQRVTAFIGPSGCGKSTFLRVLNRMNDLIDNVKITGEVLIDGINIYEKNLDVVNLRKRIGMVFQKSNLFPKTVYENLVFGLRINGIKDRKMLDEIAEKTLKQAALWEEVKDRLNEPALSLSGGQQQRFSING